MSLERRRTDPDAPWNQPRMGHAHKNTRRWCRGVPDRPHNYEVAVPVNRTSACHQVGWWDRVKREWHRNGRWSCNHALVCQSCGKIDTRWDGDCPDRPEEVPMVRRWWVTSR